MDETASPEKNDSLIKSNLVIREVLPRELTQIPNKKPKLFLFDIQVIQRFQPKDYQ